jgi:hypothetical protein
MEFGMTERNDEVWVDGKTKPVATKARHDL